MARTRNVHRLWLLAAAAVLLAQVLLSLPFEYHRVEGFATRFQAVTLDDAWIHFIYARSLARLQPFEYNPGQPETGTTSPLWCALIAPLLWFGVGPATASKILGILAATALALLAGRLAGRLMSWPFGLAAALLVCLDPLFGFAKLSGMEVLAASALLLAATLLLLERRWSAAALAAGLAVWARPDALILAGCALPLLAVALLDRRPGRQPGDASWRGALVFLAGPALAALSWGGFCCWATGRWLPATYYIRGQGMAQQLFSLETLRIVLIELRDGSPLFSHWPKLAWAGLGGLLLAGSGLVGRRRDWLRPLLLLLPLAYLALLGGRVINLIGGSFTGNRYVIPVFAFMLIWALYPAHLLGRALARRMRIKRPEIVAGVAALIVCLGLLMPPGRTLQRQRELVHEFARSALNLEQMHVATAEWVAQRYGNNVIVALYDAGVIPYMLDSEAIDINGLNNSRFEVFDEGHAAADPAWFERYCRRLETQADLLIIYPELYPSLAQRYATREVFRVQVRDPLISLGDTMVTYELSQRRPGQRPRLIPAVEQGRDNE